MLTDSAPRRIRVRSARGFSLIELTLVVVILGVLMAVVAVNVLGQGEKAKRRATEASMNTIQAQLDSYHLEYSAYPPNLALLQQLEGFLSKNKSIKDGWKRDFLYRTPGSSGRAYDLISMGGNIDDPSDDIDIWTMDLDQ
ncbi:MAG TPA: type II secretion system protein GspG [Phycisphaerales bacterium]|nr:type II secretion system protein GspG [Phycisphaerales bacterium]